MAVLSAGTARWARQPLGMSLELGQKQTTDVSLSVDFLEIIQASLPPGITFGLIHLSMAATSDDDAMLLAMRLLEEEYRAKPQDGPYIALQGPECITELGGRWLHAALAGALFGASHGTATRAHIMSLACLDQRMTESDERAWRRALGRGKSLDDARTDMERDAVRERDIARTDSFGATDITFFGQATTLTSKKPVTKWLFTFRTYWCESVLFALLQQSYLEHYARELAAQDASHSARNSTSSSTGGWRSSTFSGGASRLTPPMSLDGSSRTCTASTTRRCCLAMSRRLLQRTSKHASTTRKTPSESRSDPSKPTAQSSPWSARRQPWRKSRMSGMCTAIPPGS